MVSDDEENLEARAKRRSRRQLTPRDYEALSHYRADWADKAADADDRFFVLGSFDEGEVERVNAVCDYVNDSGPDSAVAYRMDDFAEDTDAVLNAILKFELVADDSDHIVVVCEHDEGGLLIEQGLLMQGYADKTHLLKRAYTDSEERNQYSWMQSYGVFEIVASRSWLREWETTEEFHDLVAELVTECC